MIERKLEYFGAIGVEKGGVPPSGRQTKGKINGIPPEFREAAADKCFRDWRPLWFLSNPSVNATRFLLKDRSFRFYLSAK